METKIILNDSLKMPKIGAKEYQTIENTSLKSQDYMHLTISGHLFKETIFENIHFNHCIFYSSNFVNCLFINCTFENCTFQYADFSTCNFESTQWENCNWGLGPSYQVLNHEFGERTLTSINTGLTEFIYMSA